MEWLEFAPLARTAGGFGDCHFSWHIVSAGWRIDCLLAFVYPHRNHCIHFKWSNVALAHSLNDRRTFVAHSNISVSDMPLLLEIGGQESRVALGGI